MQSPNVIVELTATEITASRVNNLQYTCSLATTVLMHTMCELIKHTVCKLITQLLVTASGVDSFQS